MKKVVLEIIKTVGILGLIAIKKELKNNGSNFYRVAKNDSLGFTAQNLIFHNLIMIKDFAQYQN